VSDVQVAAVVVLGIIAWGGLALAFAIAVGLTIREADRRERRAQRSPEERVVLTPDTERFDVELQRAKTAASPAGGRRPGTRLDRYL
jgi:hypothetical protein